MRKLSRFTPKTNSALKLTLILFLNFRNLRLNYEEEQSGLMISSERREAAMNSLPPPKDASGVAILLGDESDKEYPVFRNKEIIRTVLTGENINSYGTIRIMKVI